MTQSITIYGASDDLVEVEGAVRDEFDLARGGTRLKLTAPDGQSLGVFADYGDRLLGGRMEWTIAVFTIDSYPDWPIRFGERPDREGDPAITIEVPAGTVIEDVSAG